mgnify:CR=1 FL=1
MPETSHPYRLHHVDVSMTEDEADHERYPNDLKGGVVGIAPDVTVGPLSMPRVDFLLVVEKLAAA